MMPSYEKPWERAHRLEEEAAQWLRAFPDFADAEQFPEDLLQDAYRESSAEFKKFCQDREHMSDLARVLTHEPLKAVTATSPSTDEKANEVDPKDMVWCTDAVSSGRSQFSQATAEPAKAQGATTEPPAAEPSTEEKANEIDPKDNVMV